ncbi:hypothetical protein ACJZ2D_017230 [Fusarium nematophilum]
MKDVRRMIDDWESGQILGVDQDDLANRGGATNNAENDKNDSANDSKITSGNSSPKKYASSRSRRNFAE